MIFYFIILYICYIIYKVEVGFFYLFFEEEIILGGVCRGGGWRDVIFRGERLLKVF